MLPGKILLAALLLLGGVSAAQGQAAPQNADEIVRKLVQFHQRPDQAQALGVIIKRLEFERRGQCQRVDLDRFAPEPAGAPIPIAFGPDGAPNQGVWYLRAFVNRCGERVRHNLLYSADPEGQSVVDLLPGDTIVGRPTQLQAGATMHEFATRDQPDCRKTVIMNTRVLERPVRSAAGFEWAEIWTVRRCRDTIDVRVQFKDDGKRIDWQFSPA